jgi:diphthamide biosynthesis enzyme Dph1/Dph2-like protein
MKILNLEARRIFGEVNLKVLEALPGKTVSLAASIQYLPLLYIVRDYLQKLGKKVLIKKGPAYEGQVLGCNSSAFSKDAETLLLISDGKFHAINNAVQLNSEIYVFNSLTLEKVTFSDIERISNRRKAAVKKFLTSDVVGILVSTKFGQNYKPATALKRKVEKLGKKVYLFESDNINTAEFENFQIPIYINTACFGLGLDDSRIVNLQDIQEFLTRN